MYNRLRLLFLVIPVIVWTGCTSSIALYSPVAYEQAVSLKVDALALMDKATESYADHQAGVEALLHQILIAQEYAKGRPKNEISVRQWEILMDPGKGLLGDVLARWKAEGSLNSVYLTEKKPYIAAAFDQIIGLESGKVKPSSISDN